MMWGQTGVFLSSAPASGQAHCCQRTTTWREDMEERVMTDSAVAARFYNALRSSGLSAAALAHGEVYIGQECLLTPDEIADLARRAGVTAETSVLDIGS